ncbi:MAG: inosine kinase, partial [Myxococcota bacterium]
RNPKHYFPVNAKTACAVAPAAPARWYICGVDQVLVDAEVQVSEGFLKELNLVAGESIVAPEGEFAEITSRIEAAKLPWRFAPGGTVANSLNNYTWLSGESAVLLGAISRDITFGDAASQFLAQSPPGLDLSFLKGVVGRVGIALTLISPSGERSFVVAPGVSNALDDEDIPEALVQRSCALVTSLYTLGNSEWPIARATIRALELANAAGIPTALGLGTAGLVSHYRERVIELLQSSVNVAAMNEREAEALTGLTDRFAAAEQILEWVDMVILTQGPDGMLVGGYTDHSIRRETGEPLGNTSIGHFNQWEYSRLVRRKDAPDPLKCYSHVHPYKGGPDRLVNTNGAGDAALAAILHDLAANRYHQSQVPGSAKHAGEIPTLSYSSLSRIAQYGNRVAYEVLRGHSPRLNGPVADDEGGID